MEEHISKIDFIRKACVSLMNYAVNDLDHHFAIALNGGIEILTQTLKNHHEMLKLWSMH